MYMKPVNPSKWINLLIFECRLNEDSKVLSPEELLYRCVEAVNFTHNPQNAQMDIRLRLCK
jgi:hypothetical protein